MIIVIDKIFPFALPGEKSEPRQKSAARFFGGGQNRDRLARKNSARRSFAYRYALAIEKIATSKAGSGRKGMLLVIAVNVQPGRRASRAG